MLKISNSSEILRTAESLRPFIEEDAFISVIENLPEIDNLFIFGLNEVEYVSPSVMKHGDMVIDFDIVLPIFCGNHLYCFASEMCL